ncbi:winged helix-turn-helix transcriptional regulator [Sulfurihydrogenibium azorense]|jgi:DNA-binding HxlR family transcriptional regulator|uniref:Transcriptional regulator n=1 Tax=Sulfurihydrogenibium azorense (strain DSM 15241 / OCM 825 / Az-Fu1) TaxID=204536 RepID=C1DVU9_SULAA|nr:helix-turn-helix domain-containing protein [Sulfurihydrogenibium azorense]ACN98832.1 transcriptional regulator [Sulfurihydrogenibium azorense Az-Fu1]MDM7273583.1 helix-turn-helix domain-containing protein [Sulfurihydrogenibium azorense]
MNECPIEITLNIISGKWKFLIIKELIDGPKRFSQLNRSIKGINQRMLTKQLRELEREGIIERKVYPQIPPKVEYSLTDLGEKLHPVLLTLHQWGVEYIKSKGVDTSYKECETKLQFTQKV